MVELGVFARVVPLLFGFDATHTDVGAFGSPDADPRFLGLTVQPADVQVPVYTLNWVQNEEAQRKHRVTHKGLLCLGAPRRTGWSPQELLQEHAGAAVYFTSTLSSNLTKIPNLGSMFGAR